MSDLPDQPSSSAAESGNTDTHVPVMLDAALDHLLGEHSHGIFVDGTFGRGGHARALLQRIDASSVLYVIDRDPAAIATAYELAAQDPRVQVVEGCFSNLKAELADRGVTQVTGVLLDLGVSSPQLDEAQRGFSLRLDGPLDMRMTASGETAAQWLNTAEPHEIIRVLRTYGEEKFARRIVQRLIAARPLERTLQLADLVRDAIPRATQKPGGRHPATKTFQAIRIYINDELGELERTLPDAFELLEVGGRMAVITFHSIEARMVKRFFKTGCQPPSPPRHLPLRADQLPQPKAKTVAGPMRANALELADNPRARSAELRVLERL